MEEGKKEAVGDKAESEVDELIAYILAKGHQSHKPLVFKRRGADGRTVVDSTPNSPVSKLEVDLNTQKHASLDASVSSQPDTPSLSTSDGIEANHVDYHKLSSTTSSKSTREIKKQIATAALKCSLECEKVSRYSFKLHEREFNVVFDVDIVKMKDFKKGLKFKRLEGDIWQYKQIVTEFLDTIRL